MSSFLLILMIEVTEVESRSMEVIAPVLVLLEIVFPKDQASRVRGSMYLLGGEGAAASAHPGSARSLRRGCVSCRREFEACRSALNFPHAHAASP